MLHFSKITFLFSFLIVCGSLPASAAYFPLRDGQNVGIGNTAPAALLQVGSGGTLNYAASGDAYFQNDLEADGVIYGNGAGIVGVASSGWTHESGVVQLTTSTDNVGIGTTGAETDLEVEGAEATDATFVLDADDGDDNADTWTIKSTATGNDLRFMNHNTQIMEIDGDWPYLSIGSVSPVGNAPIEIWGGNVVLENTYSLTQKGSIGTVVDMLTLDSSNNLILGSGDDTQPGSWQFAVENSVGNYQFYTNGSIKMFFTNAGNVGIGTTTPEQLLEVQGAEGIDAGLVLDTDDGDDAADTWTLKSVAGNNNLDVLNDTNARLSLKSDGNLGVGSSTPSGRLVVVGVGTTTNNVFQVQNSSGTKMFTVTENGNVGIGNTNANYTMTIYASTAPYIRLKNDTTIHTSDLRNDAGGATSMYAWDGTGAEYYIQWGLGGGTNDIRIYSTDLRLYSNTDTTGIIFKNSNGRVGVGTTTPDTDLDLSGTVSYTPSSTQSITAVGNTILANAGVVILDPDANYTLTSAPTIANGAAGQMVYIISGNAEANSVTVQDQDTLANSNLQLGAVSRTVGTKDVLLLLFDGTDWIEMSYANN